MPPVHCSGGIDHRALLASQSGGYIELDSYNSAIAKNAAIAPPSHFQGEDHGCRLIGWERCGSQWRANIARRAIREAWNPLAGGSMRRRLEMVKDAADAFQSTVVLTMPLRRLRRSARSSQGRTCSTARQGNRPPCRSSTNLVIDSPKN